MIQQNETGIHKITIWDRIMNAMMSILRSRLGNWCTRISWTHDPISVNTSMVIYQSLLLFLSRTIDGSKTPAYYEVRKKHMPELLVTSTTAHVNWVPSLLHTTNRRPPPLGNVLFSSNYYTTRRKSFYCFQIQRVRLPEWKRSRWPRLTSNLHAANMTLSKLFKLDSSLITNEAIFS